LPVVTSIISRAKSMNLPDQGVHARMNELILSAVNVSGRPFFIYEAFLICGEAGDDRIMATLCSILNQQMRFGQFTVVDDTRRDILAAAEITLRRAGRYGQLPANIDMLLKLQPLVREKCFEPMFLELIERDAQCTPHTLDCLLIHGDM